MSQEAEKHPSLWAVRHLEPSCVSCGSLTNLSACEDCKLVHTCSQHCFSNIPPEKHHDCVGIAHAEKEFKLWNERYQAVFQHEISAHFPTAENSLEGLERSFNCQLLHGTESNLCQCYQCRALRGEDDNSHDESPKSMQTWYPMSREDLHDYGMSENICLPRLCLFRSKSASDMLFNELWRAAFQTRSGAVLRRLLDHARLMVDRGMPETFVKGEHFTVAWEAVTQLGLKFCAADGFEKLAYNSAMASLLYYEQEFSRNMSTLSGESESNLAFSDITKLALQGEHPRCGHSKCLQPETFRLLNKGLKLESGSAIQHIIQWFEMQKRILREMEPDLETGDDGLDHRLLFVTVVRALADLRSIQESTDILARQKILPTELILEIQNRVLLSPLILDDCVTMDAIRLGNDLSPSIELLTELAKQTLGHLERNAGCRAVGSKRPYGVARVPIFLPYLRTLKERKPEDVHLAGIVADIPGGSDVIEALCLDLYPQTVAKLQTESTPNPREVYSLALKEGWEDRQSPFDAFLDEDSDEDSDEDDDQVIQATADKGFPRISKRLSFSHVYASRAPNFEVHHQPSTTPDDEAYAYSWVLRDLDPKAKALAEVYDIHPTKHVPWSSWEGICTGNTRRQRAMSFDGSEAADRLAQLEKLPRDEPRDSTNVDKTPSDDMASSHFRYQSLMGFGAELSIPMRGMRGMRGGDR